MKGKNRIMERDIIGDATFKFWNNVNDCACVKVYQYQEIAFWLLHIRISQFSVTFFL